jgi:hypothetical protein
MTEPSPGGWGPCPPGELGRLAAWLTFRRRVRAATAAALLLVGGAFLIGGGWATISAFRGDSTAAGGDACCDCPTDPQPSCVGDHPPDKQ